MNSWVALSVSVHSNCSPTTSRTLNGSTLSFRQAPQKGPKVYLVRTVFLSSISPIDSPFLAVTLAPGVIWDTVYREAQEHGVSVAGGWAVDGSVGAAAGWPLGGGHSVISAYYGLGTTLSRFLLALSDMIVQALTISLNLTSFYPTPASSPSANTRTPTSSGVYVAEEAPTLVL